MLGAPRHHLLPCAKCLPRHPLPQTPCHINQPFQTCIIRTPANHRGQAEWQIPLKQSQGGFRTPGERAQQLISGVQHCACWDWFVSICLVWSSAVTMAWHAAKRLPPLIAVSSYVRVLLTGGIYDTEDKAAGLRLYANNFKIIKVQSAFPLCMSRANNEKDTHETRNEPTNSFCWIIIGNPCNSILNTVPR